MRQSGVNSISEIEIFSAFLVASLPDELLPILNIFPFLIPKRKAFLKPNCLSEEKYK